MVNMSEVVKFIRENAKNKISSMQCINCKNFIENANIMCPKCGLNDVGCYANGLCFCCVCNDVWEVNVGRQKASVFSSVSVANSLKLKILYDDEALNGFRGAFGFSCLIEEKGILFDTGGDVDTLFLTCRNSE